MTTTQIIITVCSFSISIAVLLIGYIWIDARNSIKNSVSSVQCKERMEADLKSVEELEEKLRTHRHIDGGKVIIEL